MSLGVGLEIIVRPEECGPGRERVKVRQNTQTVSAICDPYI